MSDLKRSTREELLHVASRLFYEQGFVATGIQQILNEVGIAKGTFYSHFKSKEALGLLWLQTRHQEWFRQFDSALETEGTPRAQLLAAYDFLEQWLTACNFRGCAFINVLAETPDAGARMRAEIKAHKTQLHERFQQLAGAHLKVIQGKVTEGNHLGTTLYLLFEGALVEAQNFGESWPICAARAQATILLQDQPSIQGTP